eukprot:Clim_evm4s248 gene=Clim_evmTU4s248
MFRLVHRTNRWTTGSVMQNVQQRLSYPKLFLRGFSTTDGSGGSTRWGHRLADQAFWDERYSSSDRLENLLSTPLSDIEKVSVTEQLQSLQHREWYLSWETGLGKSLTAIGRRLLAKNGGRPLRVVELGCGVSDVCLHMAQNQKLVTSYTAIDFSSKCLDLMRRRVHVHDERALLQPPRLNFVHGNIVKLTDMLEPESVDLLIDKGTLDAMIYGSPDGDYIERIDKVLFGVQTVLAPEGTIASYTADDPDMRLSMLRECVNGRELSWSVSSVLGDFMADDGADVIECFCYTGTKLPKKI